MNTSLHQAAQMALDALTADDHLGDYAAITALRAALAQPEPWQGAEEWESLAWELCADENGEDSCNELIWEGGPIKEPWGERWLKYEDEAKRLIALVRKHVAAPPAAPIDGFGGNLDEAFEPAPAVPAECCRNELLTALHSLASNYENALGMFGQDGEGRRKAEGDLEHAMKVAAKHNRNGPGCAAPAPAVPNDAALNTLAKMFHSGEEIEGDNGAAMMVDMALWHEASEAFDSLIGDGDGETLASSAAPAVREPQDERAAFEAWIRKDSGDLTTFGSGSNMHYRNSAVNNAWTGWQARAHGNTGATK